MDLAGERGRRVAHELLGELERDVLSRSRGLDPGHDFERDPMFHEFASQPPKRTEVKDS